MTMPDDRDEWNTDNGNALFAAIVALEDEADALEFFRDLCTRRELDEMTSRWAVVRLLATGMPYREINEKTGVSTATITRINQWLHHGTGGYRKALERAGITTEETS